MKKENNNYQTQPMSVVTVIGLNKKDKALITGITIGFVVALIFIVEVT